MPLFARRIERAPWPGASAAIASDARRLIHAEADGLPAGGGPLWRHLVAQFWQHRRGALEGHAIADALAAATGLTALRAQRYTVVRVGGLECHHRLAARQRWDRPLTIREHDWRLTLDIATGHKTGYYLDQRDSRQLCRGRAGSSAASACSTSATLAAFRLAAGGAREVISVDSSGLALERAERMSSSTV